MVWGQCLDEYVLKHTEQENAVLFPILWYWKKYLSDQQGYLKWKIMTYVEDADNQPI